MIAGLPLLAVPLIVIVSCYLVWSYLTGELGYDEEQCDYTLDEGWK